MDVIGYESRRGRGECAIKGLLHLLLRNQLSVWDHSGSGSSGCCGGGLVEIQDVDGENVVTMGTCGIPSGQMCLYTVHMIRLRATSGRDGGPSEVTVRGRAQAALCGRRGGARGRITHLIFLSTEWGIYVKMGKIVS